MGVQLGDLSCRSLTQSAFEMTYSELTLRLEDDLLTKSQLLAEQSGMDLNSLIEYLLKIRVSNENIDSRYKVPPQVLESLFSDSIIVSSDKDSISEEDEYRTYLLNKGLETTD